MCIALIKYLKRNRLSEANGVIHIPSIVLFCVYILSLCVCTWTRERRVCISCAARLSRAQETDFHKLKTLKSYQILGIPLNPFFCIQLSYTSLLTFRLTVSFLCSGTRINYHVCFNRIVPRNDTLNFLDKYTKHSIIINLIFSIPVIYFLLILFILIPW